jgi:hypothetical protein
MTAAGKPSSVGAQGRLWFLAGAVACWLATDAAAQARTRPGDRQRLAREHIARAEKQYQISNFPEALAEFQAAYRLSPRPELLFNLARCYEVMARLEEAIAYYQRYLAARPTARDRGLVEARLASLRARQQREAEAAAPPASAGVRAQRPPPGRAPRPPPPPPAPAPGGGPPRRRGAAVRRGGPPLADRLRPRKDPFGLLPVQKDRPPPALNPRAIRPGDAVKAPDRSVPPIDPTGAVPAASSPSCLPGSSAGSRGIPLYPTRRFNTRICGTGRRIP